jgi:FAD/FMN-containing dehydrogenase
MKRALLNVMYDEATINQMVAVKSAFDPNLILSRGNMFELNSIRSL